MTVTFNEEQMQLIRQELEDMGRKRDTSRFTKIVDMISEWREE